MKYLVFVQLIAIFLNANGQKRLYQPGNITIGVLLTLHLQASVNTCGEFYSFGLGYIEAISYTIAQINKDTSILKDVTLGIDVRDYCNSPVLAVSGAHSIGLNNFLNDLLDAQRSKELGSFAQLNVTSPVAAVIGTEDSSSTSLVSSLLQVNFLITNFFDDFFQPFIECTRLFRNEHKKERKKKKKRGKERDV